MSSLNLGRLWPSNVFSKPAAPAAGQAVAQTQAAAAGAVGGGDAVQTGSVAARRQTAANIPALSDGGALPSRSYAPSARLQLSLFDHFNWQKR